MAASADCGFHGGATTEKICNCHRGTQFDQSLDEVDFQRGIWSAALNGNLTRVRELLSKDSANANKRDESGYSPLHYACRSGHMDVVKTLLAGGAFVNLTTRAGNATCLHRAAGQGHTEIVELLLKNGADPNALDSDNMSPVHKAAEKNHGATVAALLGAGGVVDIEDRRGRTPLDLATSDETRGLLSSGSGDGGVDVGS